MKCIRTNLYVLELIFTDTSKNKHVAMAFYNDLYPKGQGLYYYVYGILNRFKGLINFNFGASVPSTVF